MFCLDIPKMPNITLEWETADQAIEIDLIASPFLNRRARSLQRLRHDEYRAWEASGRREPLEDEHPTGEIPILAAKLSKQSFLLKLVTRVRAWLRPDWLAVALALLGGAALVATYLRYFPGIPH